MTDPKPSFFWYELMTSDPAAAEAFYRGVVGWNTADFGQPDMPYTVLSAGERGMGGIAPLPAEACDQGASPGWLGYVHVPETDGAAKRIAEAGGAILRAPENIPNVGRIAVVADPGGAVFLLMTPLPQQDARPPAEPSTPGLVSWHELYAGNGQEAAFRFYADQFGWETFELMDMGPMGKYRIFGWDGVAMGGDARGLGQQREIRVHHAPAARGQQLHRMAHELRAGGTAPAWIRIREMLADVAEARRAQQRVGQCVQQYIAIGVCDHSLPVRNPHAPQHHRIAGTEGVHVEATAGTHVHLRPL